MGIVNFGNNGYGDNYTPSYLPECTIDSLLADNSIAAPVNVFESASNYILKCEKNEAIMEYVTGAAGIKMMHESGQEYVAEAGTLSSIFEAAKKFFLGIWKKIQEIFKSAAIHIAKLTKSGKDFWNTYKDDINRVLNTSELRSKMHDKEIQWFSYPMIYGNKLETLFREISAECQNPHTNDAKQFSDKSIEDAIKDFSSNHYVDEKDGEKALGTKGENKSEFNAYIKETYSSEKIKDALDGVRAKVISRIEGSNAGEKVEESEFRKEFKNALQGSDSKDSIELDKAADAVKGSYMLESAKAKSTLDKGIREAKKCIDEAIKSTERLQKVANAESGRNKNEDNARIAGKISLLCDKYLTLLEGERTILLASHATALECTKAAESQAKSILVQVLSFRNKKKSVDESTIDFSAGGVIGSLEW